VLEAMKVIVWLYRLSYTLGQLVASLQQPHDALHLHRQNIAVATRRSLACWGITATTKTK
jgi:hypothetical protein